MIGGIIDEKKVKNDPDANDVVSLLLGDPSYQETSDLIDDVIVMFFAGSKTVQGTTTNLITTMLHEPEEFARLKVETEGIMDKVKDDIMGKFDLESIQDLDQVKNFYLETMRRTSPAVASSTACMSRDVSVGGVDLRAGDAFYVGI